MDVQWTWGLAARLVGAVALSGLAAVAAAKAAFALHLGVDIATLAACGAGIAVFLVVDKINR